MNILLFAFLVFLNYLDISCLRYIGMNMYIERNGSQRVADIEKIGVREDRVRHGRTKLERIMRESQIDR